MLSDRFIPSRRSSLMDVAYSLLTASQHHNSPGGGNGGGGAGAQGEANAGNGRNAQPQSLAGAGNSGAAGERGPLMKRRKPGICTSHRGALCIQYFVLVLHITPVLTEMLTEVLIFLKKT